MASNQVVLGYWDMRGLGEPIVTLLEYLEISYKKDAYTDRGLWKQNKSTMNSFFPNLPHLIDGEKVVTETGAIYAYLCLKAGKKEMLGKEEDRVEFIQVMSVLSDINTFFTRSAYGSSSGEDLRKTIENYLDSFGGKFKFDGLEKTLNQKEWLFGYLTYADFHLAELLDRFATMDKEIGTKIVTKYPNLQAFIKRFYEIPQIKSYRESDRFRARPHNNPGAAWK